MKLPYTGPLQTRRINYPGDGECVCSELFRSNWKQAPLCRLPFYPVHEKLEELLEVHPE